MVAAGIAAQSRRLNSAAAMPIYEYRCENGHLFEVMQKMTDSPVTECEECGAPVQRVFHPVAVHFKGSGFYNTDYGTKKRARELKDSAESGADKTEAKAKEKAKNKTTSDKPAAKDAGSGGGRRTRRARD